MLWERVLAPTHDGGLFFSRSIDLMNTSDICASLEMLDTNDFHVQNKNNELLVH